MSDFVVEQEVPVRDRDPAVHSVQSSADIPSKKSAPDLALRRRLFLERFSVRLSVLEFSGHLE